MFYFIDLDIKVVMLCWGGDLVMELFDLIDFDLLFWFKLKWFVGFLDFSIFYFLLMMILGWVILYGLNFMDFGV